MVIRATVLLGAGLMMLAGGGCSPGGTPNPGAPDDGSLSVLVLNLDRFGLADRDGDGQRNDLKPAGERAAAAALIASVGADLVLAQDVEAGPGWEALLADLEAAGAAYPYHGEPPPGRFGPAVLSRRPLEQTETGTDYRFTVKGSRLEPAHGILETRLPGGDKALTLLNIQLQDRVFHPLGQSEIRRSEARLLGNRIRTLLGDRPDQLLLAAGTFNDRADSAPLAYLTDPDEAGLADLHPEDEHGHAWTMYDEGHETWERVDYLLASPALRARLRPGSTRLLDVPESASSHRALYAEFILP